MIKCDTSAYLNPSFQASFLFFLFSYVLCLAEVHTTLIVIVIELISHCTMNEMAVAASDTVSSALTSCLANAIDVYNAVQRQSDTNLARLFETLASSVQCVKGLGPVSEHVSLIKFACIQIADDLLVHFQRLDGGPVDVCGVWGRDDLSALRARLGEVLGLCQDLPNLQRYVLFCFVSFRTRSASGYQKNWSLRA